jgi:hypothetical protein
MDGAGWEVTVGRNVEDFNTETQSHEDTEDSRGLKKFFLKRPTAQPFQNQTLCLCVFVSLC